MTIHMPCKECALPFRLLDETCPHCGRPARFLNVVLAEGSDETVALQERYERALKDATVRGCGAEIAILEAAVVTDSQAVTARSLEC